MPEPGTKKKTATKKTARKKAAKRRLPPPAGTRLWVCKPGRVLFWPLPGYTPRGGPGTFVREDDPFINVRGYPDQRYKLRPVTDDELEAGRVVMTIDHEETVLPVKLTACNDRRMLREYREQGIDWMPLADTSVAMVSTIQPRRVEAQDDAEAAETEMEIPAVDDLAALQAAIDQPIEDQIAEAKKKLGIKDEAKPEA